MKTHVIKGLILKDWFSFRRFFVRQMGFIFVIYLVLGIALKSMAMLTSMITIGGMMGLMSLFALDDACQFNSFAAQLNIRPNQLVMARFITIYGILFIVTAFSILIGSGLDLFLLHPPLDSGNAALDVSGPAGAISVFLCYSLVIAVNIPLYYKLGVEKARIPTMLTIMVPFLAIIALAPHLDPVLEQFDFFTLPWGWIILCLTVLFGMTLAVSYRISTVIVSHKEF